MRKAPFVTIEGLDGAGKSSHVQTIIEELENAGWEVVKTREPGGTVLCEQVRNLILFGDQNEKFTPVSEVMMAFAARSQHYSMVIEPALESGVAVMCDRFTDSTYAYQGGGQGVDKDMIKSLEEISIGGAKPDLTILFDLSIEESRKRMGVRGNDADLFESREDEFFQRAREGYMERVQEDPERFVVIDSSLTLEEVSKNVRAAVRQFVENYEPPKPKKSFKM